MVKETITGKESTVPTTVLTMEEINELSKTEGVKLDTFKMNGFPYYIEGVGQCEDHEGWKIDLDRDSVDEDSNSATYYCWHMLHRK